MKKLILLSFLALLLSGCATYKFQHGEKPYEKGYVVSRSDYTILEYTVGNNNSVPSDIAIAKKRFKRRHHTVEHYYKKMDEIENRFKEAVVDPPAMGLKFIAGIFKLPGVAIADYRYEHNSKYREKVRLEEKLEDEKEAARIAKYREQLNDYIKRDLAKEQGGVVASPEIPAEITQEAQLESAPAVAPVVKEEGSAITQPLSSALEESQAGIVDAARQQKMSDALEKTAPLAKKKKERPVAISEPKAVITASPLKGYSPLLVRFYGSKSLSRGAKITSYQWDFGDGDTSNKPNTVNTYYSGAFYPKNFAVTLTVTDNQGNTDTAHMLIEVLNK